MYTLNVYEQSYYMCIQGLLLTSNDFNIMVTLGVYFEYILKLYVTYLLKYFEAI
jgi:hypothetical protein